MISAQDLIEKITAAATCDDCIVVVKDKTQANLRWAGSSLTTNGVIQERSVTIVSCCRSRWHGFRWCDNDRYFTC